MLIEADRYLALSSVHVSRGDAAKNEFFCRMYAQSFCYHRPLRSLQADSYVTCVSQNSTVNGKSVRSWPTLLSLSNEKTVLSDGSPAQKSLTHPAAGNIEQKTRNIDVTTFGNLCVDIVLNVPTLPPASFKEKLDYMKKLASSSPDEKLWEAGGNSNFAIAAARLGLQCAALGHIGGEKYGNFLYEVLEKEGVQVVRLQKDKIQEETLLCWVLVDPDHCHGFCSRFDFNKNPAFKYIKELPRCAKEVIQRSKVLFCNGFLFDELTPELITSAVDFASETGCLLFFDPGPRGKSLFQGPIDQQQALQKILGYSDVLLLTAGEAEAVTGIADPVLSAKELLARGRCTKWVVVKMGDKGCFLTTAHGVYQVPAFTVDVKDTVGCGDSFAAAITLGYTRGLPILSTLALANAVGAATAMGCGAGRNVATLDNVRSILLSSKALEDSDRNGLLQTFSTEQWVKMGMSQLDNQDLTASQNMPFIR